jgi:hypothetical protein
MSIVNIGTRQSGKRLAFGIFMFAISALSFVLMMYFKVGHVWRLVLFPPLFASAMGFFQAKAKT